MIKNYLLLSFLAFTISASSSVNPVKPKRINPLLNCAEIPTITVLHPNCESPATGTVTVTWPVEQNLEYSIDGINYQLAPVFFNVLPGAYQVKYRNIISGCTSEPNVFVMDASLAVGTIEPTSESILADQTICVNTAMEVITYAVGGVAEMATVSGLPPGVNGVFADGTFTISGTPSASGVYSYTVTAIGGACPVETAGTLVVRNHAAIAWMSSSGARNQTLCQGFALNPIRYIIANGATGAITVGLPQGLSGTFSGGIFTISGQPEVSGIYNYTVATTGGCSVAVSTGTLTVNAAPLINLECDSEGSDADSLAFQWLPVSGVTAYNYSYQINGGPLVSGTAVNPAALIAPLSAGHSVIFTIQSVNGNVPCFSPQSTTCVVQPLASQTFDEANFAYFPNPVTDRLHLEYSQPFSTIAIYNTVGQEVLYRSIDSDKVAIDLSNLQSGVYFVKINTADAAKTIRLIKQ